MGATRDACAATLGREMRRSRHVPWWLTALALVIGVVLARVGWFEQGRDAQSADATHSAPSSIPTVPAPSSIPTVPAPSSSPTVPAPSSPAIELDRGSTELPEASGSQAPPRRELATGFTSKRAWREHFAKHGAEFGKITAEEYLRLAQGLRDAPRSQLVLERVRDDGVITRYDRASGAFLAFHRDLSIRTFFRPKDGEAYFERQALR